MLDHGHMVSIFCSQNTVWSLNNSDFISWANFIEPVLLITVICGTHCSTARVSFDVEMFFRPPPRSSYGVGRESYWLKPFTNRLANLDVRLWLIWAIIWDLFTVPHERTNLHERRCGIFTFHQLKLVHGTPAITSIRGKTYLVLQYPDYEMNLTVYRRVRQKN